VDPRKSWDTSEVGRHGEKNNTPPAVHKGHNRKKSGEASLARGIPKRRTFETRREICYNGIWNRVSKDGVFRWAMRNG
jgi:hypothetical protein